MRMHCWASCKEWEQGGGPDRWRSSYIIINVAPGPSLTLTNQMFLMSRCSDSEENTCTWEEWHVKRFGEGEFNSTSVFLNLTDSDRNGKQWPNSIITCSNQEMSPSLLNERPILNTMSHSRLLQMLFWLVFCELKQWSRNNNGCDVLGTTPTRRDADILILILSAAYYQPVIGKHRGHVMIYAPCPSTCQWFEVVSFFWDRLYQRLEVMREKARYAKHCHCKLIWMSCECVFMPVTCAERRRKKT